MPAGDGDTQVTELQRWDTDSGTIVVEGDDEMVGFAPVVRNPGEVARVVNVRFEEALKTFRDSAASALTVFRDDALRPDEIEIEFGLKLNAEAGAVLAKAAAEGHLKVTLRWAKDEAPGA
ncbi:hypothetical protein AGRA3207_002083 [Actinomadura graeca]|uniref:Trypsin-co-occurring domain-containing protein n=1 Tax=Actinomadura graeca TaxID=2750812 RepID=A0ABX8QR14_9ACTN|nr:hypothetical protein AGRA3207_002083 [Actinomadura graeca]